MIKSFIKLKHFRVIFFASCTLFVIFGNAGFAADINQDEESIVSNLSTVMHYIDPNIYMDPVTLDIQAENGYFLTQPKRQDQVQRQCEELQKESIVDDEDERISIENTHIWPNCIHGKISINFSDRKSRGSGVMVGPYHFLTAGHCILHHKENGEKEWASIIRVYLGLNGENRPFDEALAVKIHTFKRYVDDQDKEFDIALITLDRPIGLKTGWAGLLYLDDHNLLDRIVHVTGYPRIRGNTLWSMGRKFLNPQNIAVHRLFYDIDTSGGQSGGAIWVDSMLEENMVFVLGVHTHGGNNQNSGVRLSKDKLRVIVQHWINNTYSNSIKNA